MAIQLNFTSSQIQNLQINAAGNPRPAEKASFAMLSDWLGKEPKATWADLISAIRLACEHFAALAEEIEQALQ